MIEYTSSYDRKKSVVIILLLSLVLTYLFNSFAYEPYIGTVMQSIKDSNVNLYFFLDILGFIKFPLSYGFFFILMWKFYDKYAWKLPFIHFNSGIPDISGEWIGILKSDRKNKRTKEYVTRKMKMEIKQTFTKMRIDCTFYDDSGDNINSTSVSDVIAIIYDDSGIDLKFSFVNQSREIGTKATKYYGHNEFRIENNATSREMIGTYFTGRDSGQHKGVMELFEANTK